MSVNKDQIRLPGGVFVATEQLGNVGEVVTLRFAVPTVEDPLILKAEVRWLRAITASGRSGSTGMGLKFRNLNLHAAASIEEFLSREQAKPSSS